MKGAALKAAAEGRFDELPIHNPSIECASRERIEAIQLARLIDQVEWTYNRVAWYRDKMDAMGREAFDIKTLADVRKLPFTDKNALRKRSPAMACLPNRSTISLNCMPLRALGQI